MSYKVSCGHCNQPLDEYDKLSSNDALMRTLHNHNSQNHVGVIVRINIVDYNEQIDEGHYASHWGQSVRDLITASGGSLEKAHDFAHTTNTLNHKHGRII